MTVTLVCDNLENGRKRIRIPETGEILESESTWENFLRRRGTDFDRQPEYVSFSDTAKKEFEARVEKEVKEAYYNKVNGHFSKINAIKMYIDLTRDPVTHDKTIGLLEAKQYVERVCES